MTKSAKNNVKQIVQEAVKELKHYVDISRNDLKQYVDAKISQQTSDIRSDLGEVKNDIVKVDSKGDALSTSIGEALDPSNDTTQKQLNDYELRIVKLEKLSA